MKKFIDWKNTSHSLNCLISLYFIVTVVAIKSNSPAYHNTKEENVQFFMRL